MLLTTGTPRQRRTRSCSAHRHARCLPCLELGHEAPTHHASKAKRAGVPACLVGQTCQRAQAARHRHGKATVDDVVPACSLPAAHGTPQNGGAYTPCLASQTCRRATLTCRADLACLVSQACQRAKAARHRHAEATVDDVVPACSLTAAHGTPQNWVTWHLPTVPRKPSVAACHGNLPWRPSVPR